MNSINNINTINTINTINSINTINTINPRGPWAQGLGPAQLILCTIYGRPENSIKSTNNINSKPNKFNNPQDNPLLYDVSEGPNGIDNQKNNTNNSNYLYLKKDVNKADNVSYLKNKQQNIQTLPEGSKITKINQKKKLNALLNIRAQQDFNIFGSEVDTSFSSDKQKININDETNELNSRINKINFVIEPQLNLQNISNKNNKGIDTSRIIINKNSLKEN